MSNQGNAVAAAHAASQELDELRLNADRWRYFAGRLAPMLGLSIEEVEREIDQAIKAEREVH